MFGSIQICRVFGIPIRVHVTLLLVLPYLSQNLAPGGGYSAGLWGLIAAVALFASVALHELGHSLVALRLGYRVRDITLLPIGGVAMLADMPSRPRDELLIAIAGPIVSLLLGLAGVFASIGVGKGGLSNFGTTVATIGGLNLMLFAFNLIPAFPMDGGRVLRAALSMKLSRLEATRIAARLGRFLAVLYGLFSLFVVHSLIQVALAIFVYFIAGQEYRMVQLQELRRWNPVFNWWGRAEPPPLPDMDVTVSPPPYRR